MNSLNIESWGTASLGIGKNNLINFNNLLASSYTGESVGTSYSNGSTYVRNTPNS